MEKLFSKAEELADSLKDYVNTRIDEVKLSTAEKSSAIIANVLAGIVVAVVFLFFFIFGSMALAYGLGEWIGKTWAGFLLVAGLYLLIGVIVWVGRGKLIRLPIMNAMLRQLFKNEEDEDD